MFRRGFTAVELLITLFVASIFLSAGYTLFSFIIRDSGNIRAEVRASRLASDYIDQFSRAEGDCTPSNPLTDEPVVVDGLTDVRVSVVISCPNPAAPNIGLVKVTITYNAPEKIVAVSGYSLGTGVPLEEAPAIAQQPTEASIAVAETASFSVATTGYPTPTIQWEVSKDKGVSWTSIDGATGTTLAFSSVPSMEGNLYRAVAANTVGQVNSDAVSLFVADTGWHSLPLQNGWIFYGSPYSPPAYRRTADGVVVLKGMIKSGALGTVATLPESYRPAYQLMFSTSSNNNTSGARVDVHPDGSVVTSTGVSNLWLSLDTIRFIPDNGRYDRQEVNPLSNGWSNYGASLQGYDFAPASYAVDDSGRVHIDGLVAPGTTTSGTEIMSLPDNLRPSEYLHYHGRSSTYAPISIERATKGIIAKGVGSNHLSLQTMYYPGSLGTWNNFSLLAGWTWYGSIYGTPQYTKSSDGIVTLKGLVKGGSTADGTDIAVLPVGYRPSERILSTTVSTDAHARIDILADGRVQLYAVRNTWLSLDNISFYAGDPSYMDDMVAWWPMNGSAEDVINDNDGTVNGASLTYDRSGEPNKAYSFDGDNDTIAMPDVDYGSGALSVCFWFRPLDPSGAAYQYLFSHGSSYDGPNAVNVWLDEADISTFPMLKTRMNGASGSAVVDFPHNYFDSSWHHYCATSSAGTMIIYTDGSLQSSVTSGNLGSLNPDGGIYIASRSYSSADRYFPGSMDDVRVYSRALSAAEVQELYNAGAL